MILKEVPSLNPLVLQPLKEDSICRIDTVALQLLQFNGVINDSGQVTRYLDQKLMGYSIL